MKPVHLYASLGALLVIGSFPVCHGDAKCGAKKTCETAQTCVTRHGGKENIQSTLLFPCTNAKGRRVNVCCPIVVDPAVVLRIRMSAMKHFDMENCGKESSERIKNGFEAKSGEFPWMALLGYSVNGEKNKTEYLCGGTLITKQLVLTAAHCLSAPERRLSEVRFGEHDLRTDPDCVSLGGPGEQVCAAKVVTRKVVGYYAHEKYSLRELKNDIALVWLDQAITMSDTVRPICLPFNRSTIGQDVKLRVSGWGKLDHDNDVGSQVLQWTYVNTTSNDDCNALIAPGNREITSSQICASGYSGEDACKGDSGGPLMYLDPELSSAVQVGIVSYGLRKCGMLNSPTVYTRVSMYTDWVLDNMQKQ